MGDTHDPLCQECAIQLSQLYEPLTSPVRHLPSTPTEEFQIRDAISKAGSRINDIDVTTAEIQLLLSNLAEQRARVHDYRAKHIVLAAPVWRIPPEILSYIFVLSLSHPPLNEVNRRSLEQSLLLTQVIHHWRQVALSIPQLWTTIFLDSKSLGGAAAEKSSSSSSLCMPKLCLERSGIFPLSISVFSRKFNVDILDFIIPLSDRWRRMSLNTNMTMLQALFPIRGKLSRLEHLEIRNSQRAEGPLPACGLLSYFSEAPCLHNPTSLNISTDTITNLSSQLHHLPRFPYLRNLSMYCDKRVSNNSPENTLVPFFAKSGGQLQYLTFGQRVALDMVSRCLAYTPKLRSLHIHRMTSDLLLNDLTLPEGSGDGCLVPKLETVTLSGKLHFQARTLTKLIRSRWQNTKPSSSSAPPSGSTSTSYCSNGDAVADNTTTIPVHDAHPRTLRSVLILPTQERFDIHEKNELLALNQQGFEVIIRTLKITSKNSQDLMESYFFKLNADDIPMIPDNLLRENHLRVLMNG